MLVDRGAISGEKEKEDNEGGNEQGQEQEGQEGQEQQKRETPASADDVAALKEQLANLRGVIDGLTAGGNQRQQSQSQPQERQIPEYDEADIEALIANGGQGGGKKIREAINNIVERRVSAIEARINQIESFGTEAIGNLSERVASSDMPLLKHARYGPIIRGEMKKLSDADPRLKTNPNILKAVHDRVAGENQDAIFQERMETLQRQAREKGGGSPPTDNNGRQGGGGGNKDNAELPTLKELLGADAADALESIGRTPEQHARGLGHASYADYVKAVQSQQRSAA